MSAEYKGNGTDKSNVALFLFPDSKQGALLRVKECIQSTLKQITFYKLKEKTKL